MRVMSFSTSIVASITIFFIFSNPAAGIGGWYIDEETCSESARTFLEAQLQRARVGHMNLATFLSNRDMFNEFEEFSSIAYRILGGHNQLNSIDTARVVFAGGNDPTRDGTPYIDGLASWTGPVPRVETFNSPNGLVAWPFLSFNYLLRH